MARRKSAPKRTATKSAQPPAARYFDPSQLALAVPRSAAPSEPEPPIDRGVDLREAMMTRVPYPGATTVLYERSTPEWAGRDRWVVVVSPDRTCAFAYAGRHDGIETQSLTHWAVAWSEAPAAHTMWRGQWARLARKRGSRELLEQGALCRVCRTRDAEKCEAIQRAQRALANALEGRKGPHGRR